VTTVGWLMLIDVLVSAIACVCFGLVLHWRTAARSTRDRLQVVLEDNEAEMQRVLDALIERYGHEAALVALDAAARRPRRVEEFRDAIQANA
jgi:hypothetical protein